MQRLPGRPTTIFSALLVALLSCVSAGVSDAQIWPAQTPAYLVLVEGDATIDRDGEPIPAAVNMPFVQGDVLRTTNGRVQIAFPDGTAIEVAENSAVECVSPSRVRLIAGTMDHVQRAVADSQSATYLPHELDAYGSTLDQNGAWQYDAPYGYVWYPTVAPDWRPYYNGYWSSVRSYGWTWIGADTWAWPTHHYGRWGYARNRWFWIPGRTWGPGWVSWGSAVDYVSWCPLGFNGQPVFALSFSSGTPWLGWTVLSRSHFGSRGFYANRYALDMRRIPRTTAFVAHSTPPLPTQRAGLHVVDRQSPAAGRQPPVGSRQSPVASGQSPVGQPQIAVPRTGPPPMTVSPSRDGRRQPPGTQPPAAQPPAAAPGAATRQLPVELHRGRPATPPSPEIPTRYGAAVPRTPPNQPNQPPTPPAFQPPTPGYRVPSSGYSAPNEHRIERAAPRGNAPANAAPPSPRMTLPPSASPRSEAPPARSNDRPAAAPQAPPAGRPGPPPQAAPRSGGDQKSGGESKSRGGADGRGRPR
jgi:uncharacterized protein DUF6600